MDIEDFLRIMNRGGCPGGSEQEHGPPTTDVVGCLTQPSQVDHYYDVKYRGAGVITALGRDETRTVALCGNNSIGTGETGQGTRSVPSLMGCYGTLLIP